MLTLAWWIGHLLGIDDTTGPWSGFWSGFGADIGELAIVGSLLSLYRKHTCEVSRCWRIGRHKTKAGHTVCRRHHPDDALTASSVRDAHDQAQRS